MCRFFTRSSVYPLANDRDETAVLCIPFLPFADVSYSAIRSSFSFVFFSTDNDEVNRPDLYTREMSVRTKEKEKKATRYKQNKERARDRVSDDLLFDFLS
jgi:hypothetical protein